MSGVVRLGRMIFHFRVVNTAGMQFLWGGLVSVLLFWLIGLLVAYLVIYLAVKHALDNSRSLRELREEIRALRMSGPPRDPASGSPYGPGTGGYGDRM